MSHLSPIAYPDKGVKRSKKISFFLKNRIEFTEITLIIAFLKHLAISTKMANLKRFTC